MYKNNTREYLKLKGTKSKVISETIPMETQGESIPSIITNRLTATTIPTLKAYPTYMAPW